MKKLLLSLFVAATAMTASADKIVLDFTDPTTFGYEKAESGKFSQVEDGAVIKSGSISISVSFPEGKNGLRFFTNTNSGVPNLRAYVDATFTVSTSGSDDMNKIEINGSNLGDTYLTADGYANGTWTGSSKSVTFKCIKSTVQMNTMTITVGEDNGTDVTPDVPAAEMTIAEAQAAAEGTNVSIAGTVFAACKNGAVIGDATGYIYYYNTASDLAVGDVVNMEGKVTAYGGFNQLTAAAEVEKVSTGGKVTYPEVVKLDGAGLDAWFAAPKIQYVQLTGELVISGNYYNLNVEGAETAVGSLVGPLPAILGDVTNNSKVTVTGFAMYTSGSKYVNIVATELVIGEKAETVDITNTLETAYSVSKCIELIDAGKGLENKVYIKGIVCAPYKDIFVDLEHGNATFFISEDGKAESQQFEIYRGYDFGGEKFTEEKIKLGDEVVFYGTLTKFKDTYETNQGAELVLLNGKDASSIESITTDAQHAVVYDLSGRRVRNAQNGLYIVNGKKVLR